MFIRLADLMFIRLAGLMFIRLAINEIRKELFPYFKTFFKKNSVFKKKS